jgi:hypothetical protein
VTQATSEPSDQCPDASLTTGFVIEDGGPAPVAVATQEPWLCFGTGNQYRKSPPWRRRPRRRAIVPAHNVRVASIWASGGRSAFAVYGASV